MTHAWASIRATGRAVVAMLLLLVIAAHAMAPHGAPFERRTGSAFSAATEDVSLQAKAADAMLQAVPAIEPPPPPAIAVLTSLPFKDAAIGLPRATGPPAAETTFSPLLQTGPPAA